MKVTELMRGDYVAIFGETREIAAKVAEIYEKGIITMGGSARLEDEITPIKLTPEILEKNGFVRRDFYDELKVGEEWRIMCDTKQVAILHREHVNLDTPICYVHELQHALRLSRIEKEITL